MNRPAERDHLSVQTFMENGKPLLQGDSGFINEKEDLVTLRPGRENAWLDAFVERMLKHCHCKLVQVCPWLINLCRSNVTKIKL